jgi:hypothetical protein
MSEMSEENKKILSLDIVDPMLPWENLMNMIERRKTYQKLNLLAVLREQIAVREAQVAGLKKVVKHITGEDGYLVIEEDGDE